MGKLYLELVTPEKMVVSQEVDTMAAPGTLGEFGVLQGHVSFLTGIQPGELHYRSGGETSRFVVTTGFAEVFNNKVSVLVDAAESATEIDVERARQAEMRARKRLEERKREDVDYLRAESALKRAVARLKVAGAV